MKIKELKHNHSLTDLLKVLLFSILMLAPILAIGVKCAYVIINKNAKDSYSGSFDISYKYQSNEVNQSSDLIIGNIYTLTFNEQPTNTPTGYTEILHGTAIYNVIKQNGKYNLQGETNNAYYRIRYNNSIIVISSESYTTEISIPYDTISFPFSFDFVLYNALSFDFTQTNIEISKSNYNVITDVNTGGTLDNVFYYAINEIAQEPLFNWTQNTAIYTGVNAMCTGMEITSPIIPILITYWFLLTCIYMIIDILIKGFTMLTHLIGSKMA